MVRGDPCVINLDNAWSAIQPVIANTQERNRFSNIAYNSMTPPCVQCIVAEFIERAPVLWQDSGGFTPEGSTQRCPELLADGLLVLRTAGAHQAHAQVLPKPGA